MGFNGAILSSVYDISRYKPNDKDKFFVDTNVWLWMTYSKGIPEDRKFLYAYNTFIDSALKNNSQLFHSGLSLAELAHVIEKTEREIHSEVIKKKIQTKDFRHNYKNERLAAIKEIETSWMQVETLASQVDITLNQPIISSCLGKMSSNTLDGYDLMIHESMLSSGILNILTDDGDYTTVPGINVFTMNRNVLHAAHIQKKLSN